MKKTTLFKSGVIAACVCGLVACCGLTACGGGGDVSYKDGTYTGQSTVFIDEDEGNGNGYGVATITIKDGAIASCEFLTYEEDGTLKDKDYGKTNGKVTNQDFYNKAQKAVAGSKEYAEKLVEAGSLAGVECISGATISYGEFQEAVEIALDEAAE